MSATQFTIFGNINGEIRRRNISQEKLCEELGIERRRYVNWQQKGDMPVSYFMRIAEMLGCSLDYLARDVHAKHNIAEGR